MHIRLRRSLTTIVVTAIVVIAPILALADTPFFTETIDPGGFVGTYIRLAVDHNGTPHVVYWDLSNQFLRYATRVNGIWTTDVVIGQGFVGTDCDIAVDHLGQPHISFHNFTLGSDELYYAYLVGKVWTVEVVDGTANDVGRYNAIAVDSYGYPHISYYDETLANLKYAIKNPAWSISSIATTGLVGEYSDIALDTSDRPHVSYYSATVGAARYAQKVGSTWYLDTVGNASADYTGVALDAAGKPTVASRSGGYLDVQTRSEGGWAGSGINSVSDFAGALTIDGEGQLHLFYQRVTGGADELWYAVERDTGWAQEEAAGGGLPVLLAEYSDIALDPYDNPVGVYSDDTNGDAMYIDSGVRLSSQLQGATWPVGGERTIRWRGVGTVDILLSTNGGASYEALATGLTGGAGATGGHYTFTVPHQPSRFCKIKLERQVPYAASLSESLFTIETDIALLSFVVTLDDGLGGSSLAWSTNPGPEDLAGYRIDRQRDGGWATIVPLTSDTQFHDATGRSGDEYRLFAINGLGQPLLMGTGRAGQTPSYAPIDVFPNPFGAGELTVVFATAGGLGGGAGQAVVSVYDVAGRLVRKLADDRFNAGVQTVTWDGRDANGRLVASGVYFVRSNVGAEVHTKKVSLVR